METKHDVDTDLRASTLSPAGVAQQSRAGRGKAAASSLPSVGDESGDGYGWGETKSSKAGRGSGAAGAIAAGGAALGPVAGMKTGGDDKDVEVSFPLFFGNEEGLTCSYDSFNFFKAWRRKVTIQNVPTSNINLGVLAQHISSISPLLTI